MDVIVDEFFFDISLFVVRGAYYSVVVTRARRVYGYGTVWHRSLRSLCL